MTKSTSNICSGPCKIESYVNLALTANEAANSLQQSIEPYTSLVPGRRRTASVNAQMARKSACCPECPRLADIAGI